MIPPRFSNATLIFSFIIAIVSCSEAPAPVADTAPATGQGRQGELRPPTEPEEALLELSYQGGMIANPDPTPLVRVYPDGKVLVHYPAYMKRAGDYTLNLDNDELQELLVSFSNDAVLLLQPSDLAMMTAQIQANIEEPRIDSHGVESVVRIRGESFTPEGSLRPAIFNVDQTIRAPNTLLAAAPDSPYDNLKSLATGVQRLEELSRSDFLERIDVEK